MLNAAKSECWSVESLAAFWRSPCILPAAEKTRSTPADDASAAKYCLTILASAGHFASRARHHLRMSSSHHPPRLAQPPPSLLLLDASAEEAAEEDLPLSLTLRRLEERKWASPSEKEWASPSREGHGEGLPRSPQVGATPE